jgi:hypothetical protein
MPWSAISRTWRFRVWRLDDFFSCRANDPDKYPTIARATPLLRRRHERDDDSFKRTERFNRRCLPNVACDAVEGVFVHGQCRERHLLDEATQPQPESRESSFLAQRGKPGTDSRFCGSYGEVFTGLSTLLQGHAWRRCGYFQIGKFQFSKRLAFISKCTKVL